MDCHQGSSISSRKVTVGSLKISKDFCHFLLLRRGISVWGIPREWKLAGDQESIGAERAIMIAVLEFWSFPGDQKLVFI
jgi:hypothetical protein